MKREETQFRKNDNHHTLAILARILSCSKSIVTLRRMSSYVVADCDMEGVVLLARVLVMCVFVEL